MAVVARRHQPVYQHPDRHPVRHGRQRADRRRRAAFAGAHRGHLVRGALCLQRDCHPSSASRDVGPRTRRRGIGITPAVRVRQRASVLPRPRPDGHEHRIAPPWGRADSAPRRVPRLDAVAATFWRCTNSCGARRTARWSPPASGPRSSTFALGSLRRRPDNRGLSSTVSIRAFSRGVCRHDRRRSPQSRPGRRHGWIEPTRARHLRLHPDHHRQEPCATGADCDRRGDWPRARRRGSGAAAGRFRTRLLAPGTVLAIPRCSPAGRASACAPRFSHPANCRPRGHFARTRRRRPTPMHWARGRRLSPSSVRRRSWPQL